MKLLMGRYGKMLKYEYIVVEYFQTKTGVTSNIVGFYENREKANEVVAKSFKDNSNNANFKTCGIFEMI